MLLISRTRRTLPLVLALALPAALVLAPHGGDEATASQPGSTTLSPPTGSEPSKVTWTGSFALTGRVDPAIPCQAAQDVSCDTHELKLNVPQDYWDDHTGSVTVAVTWQDSTNDLDLEVKDADGNVVGSSASGGTVKESVDLGELEPGTYTVEVGSYVVAPRPDLQGIRDPRGHGDVRARWRSTRTTTRLMDLLTVRYPLRVVFVGRTPSKAEIAELRDSIPTEYKPTVANKSRVAGRHREHRRQPAELEQAALPRGREPLLHRHEDEVRPADPGGRQGLHEGALRGREALHGPGAGLPQHRVRREPRVVRQVLRTVPRGGQGRGRGLQGHRPDQDRPHRRLRRRGLDLRDAATTRSGQCAFTERRDRAAASAPT